jgi:hypothetical protein
LGSHGACATPKYSFEMTVMTVTFFNASGIDFGNCLNAHLGSKKLSPHYATSTAMTPVRFPGKIKGEAALCCIESNCPVEAFSVECFLTSTGSVQPLRLAPSIQLSTGSVLRVLYRPNPIYKIGAWIASRAIITYTSR